MKNLTVSKKTGMLFLTVLISLFTVINLRAQNVGIGTTNPSSKLHIYDGNLKLEFDSNPFIHINSLTTDGKAGINFQQSGTSTGWLFFDDLTDKLHLNASTDDSRPDLVINSAGQIGIGTDSPLAPNKLHILGAVRIEDGTPIINLWPTGTSKLAIIKFYDGDPIGQIYSDGVQDCFKLTTDLYRSRDDLAIDANGYIGIGTHTPEEKLHVEGTIEVDQKIQANDSGGLEFATDDGTTVMNIIDNGNIGIGTTTPDEKLEVNGTIEVNQKIQAHDTGGLEFSTADGTSRVYITNSGNVGIGTPGPSTSLHVYGGQIKLESSNPLLRLKSTLADVSIGIFMYDNVETTKAKLFYNTDLDRFELTTDNFGIRADLVMTSSGQVGIGTFTPGLHKLYVSSSGTGSTGSAGYFVNTHEDGIAMNIENSSNDSDDNALLVTNRGEGNIASFDSYHGNNTWDREFRFTYDGHGYCDQTWHAGGADYAEYFAKADESEIIRPGDVIAMSPDKGYSIVKADASMRQLILGVYSSNPAIVGNSPADEGPEDGVLVGLMGVVTTKVCAENGSIRIGDFLTVSARDGVASKAVTSGMVIGRALENYNGAGTGMIKVMVDVTWVHIEKIGNSAISLTEASK